MDTIVSIAKEPLTWTVFFAVLAIIATLIAPRFGRRGKLLIGLESVKRIRSEDNLNRAGFQYTLADRVIEDDIYLIDFQVKNRGIRDIKGQDFIEPLSIIVPPNTSVVSVSCDDNCEIEIQDDGQEVRLNWLLLKHRQSIAVSAVCTANPSMDLNFLNLSFKHAIQDVDVIERKHRPLFWLSILSFSAIALVTALAVWMINTESKTNIFATVDGVTKPALITKTDMKTCDARLGIWTLRNCEEIHDSVQPILSVSPDMTPVGFSLISILLPLVMMVNLLLLVRQSIRRSVFDGVQFGPVLTTLIGLRPKQA